MSAATRNKRYRARRATGIAMLTIPAREFELIEALLTAERLTVVEALDRRRLAHAAAQVVDDFIRRWAKNRDA